MMNELQGVRMRDNAIRETDLLRGYTGVSRPELEVNERTEACACGEVIYVRTQDAPVIAAAVVAHQQIAEHRAWRKRAGFA